MIRLEIPKPPPIFERLRESDEVFVMESGTIFIEIGPKKQPEPEEKYSPVVAFLILLASAAVIVGSVAAILEWF